MGLVADLEKLRESVLRNSNLDKKKVRKIEDKLKDLWRKRIVKSNHSLMEFLVAVKLIEEGFEVEVENPLTEDLTCDVYAEKNGKALIVEVETGFVPPYAALTPTLYRFVREVSKIVRYSNYSDLFALATPIHHVLQVPEFYVKSKSFGQALRLKEVLDKYYTNPPVSIDEILSSHIEYVYLVNVDIAWVKRIGVLEYYENFTKRHFYNGFIQLDYLIS